MSACAPEGKAARRYGSRRAEAAICRPSDHWWPMTASLPPLEMQRRWETAMQEPRPASRRTASTMDLSKTSSTNQDRRARLHWLASAAEAPSYFDRTASKSALRPLSSLVPLNCYRAEHVARVAAHDNPC